jgi:hypothetical protein
VPERHDAASGFSPALPRLAGPGFGDVWGRKPLLHKASGDFSDLLSVAAVDDLLSGGGLRTPFLRLVRDGKLIKPNEFTGSGGLGAEVADQVLDDRVLDHLAQGATLVLQGLHRIWPPLRDFCGRLGEDLGCAVQANAYLTPPGRTGFHTHYDTHDVFVIQVAGGKHWRVYEPVYPDPLPRQAWGARAEEVDAAASGPPVLDETLRPGDVLYLPRGWLHAASSVDETSLHITLGLHRPTAYTLVETLLQLASEEESLRSGLPLGLDITDADELEPHLKQTVQALTRWLSTVDPQRVALRLRPEQWRSARPEPLRPVAQHELLEGLTPQTMVRVRRGLGFALTTQGPRLRISLADRLIELPVEGAEAVRDLLGGQPVPVGADPGRQTIARRLLREGLLIPA